MEIGAAVDESILKKIRKVFDLNKGDDAVFRTKNGAPKIMTKFKDKPYSYELLPEYANGSKKFPTVKSMNWEGKTATAKVIRGFTSSTPVVQRCPNPRSISRSFPNWHQGRRRMILIMDFESVSTLSSTSASSQMPARYILLWMRSRNWHIASSFCNWMERMRIGASLFVRKA